jgi:hypothetical protein
MGYLYRHIRLDKNEVFYIGIGGFSINEKKNSYKRAYTKFKRNKIWNRIIDKTQYKTIRCRVNSNSYKFENYKLVDVQ